MIEREDVEEVESVLEGWNHHWSVRSLGSVHCARRSVVAIIFLQSLDIFSMG